MTNTEQNTTEQIVTKKKKVKVLPFVIIGIIILVVVAVLAVLVVKGVATASNEKKVQEQLDLGERYLQELDYEQAIVAYTTAIEIDPKNVDAYLGLADVYVAMDDYDQAIEVLEQGYDETEDEKIKDRMEDLTEEKEAAQFPKEVIPAKVVDGVYHNAYYEYDLSEEHVTYLNDIIASLETENYSVALENLNCETMKDIILTIRGEEQVEANIALDGKKVYIKCIGESVMMFVMPQETGKGYALYIDKFDIGESQKYLCGDCKNGVFWGDFIAVETYFNDGITREFNCEGTAVNGLIHGELRTTRIEDSYTDVYVYDMGRVRYTNIYQDEDGKTYIIYPTCTYDGDGVLISDSSTFPSTRSGVELTRDLLENHVCTIEYLCDACLNPIESSADFEGGYKYYNW